MAIQHSTPALKKVKLDDYSGMDFGKLTEDVDFEDSGAVNETHVFSYETLMRHQLYSKVVSALNKLHIHFISMYYQ